LFCGCSDKAARNPYSKDAACPPEPTRALSFEKVYQKQGNRSLFFTRECDYLTFIGNPTADIDAPGGMLNPVLDNTYELTGALVSSFDPMQETFLDKRMLSPADANPHAQVGIDFQAGLTNALAGLAALPPSFYAEACPTPVQMKDEFRLSRAAAVP
jgi:hypothetical protein